MTDEEILALIEWLESKNDGEVSPEIMEAALRALDEGDPTLMDEYRAKLDAVDPTGAVSQRPKSARRAIPAETEAAIDDLLRDKWTREIVTQWSGPGGNPGAGRTN